MPKVLPDSFSYPIAFIGCGGASMSAATYLARLGLFARNYIID